jgi:hypothetical protein
MFSFALNTKRKTDPGTFGFSTADLCQSILRCCISKKALRQIFSGLLLVDSEMQLVSRDMLKKTLSEECPEIDLENKGD